MRLEEAVAARLIAQGVGAAGKDVFALFMPESAKEGVLVLPPLQGLQRDFELPGYRRGSFQVVVRGREMNASIEKAQAVIAALEMDEVSIDNVLFRYVRAKHDPVVYPMSKGHNFEASVNFETVFILT